MDATQGLALNSHLALDNFFQSDSMCGIPVREGYAS